MNNISETTRKILALSMLNGVGPATLRRVSAVNGLLGRSIEEIASSNPAIARGLKSLADWTKAEDAAEKQVHDATMLQAQILSPFDEGYPPLLAATKDDPFIIYVRGRLHSDPSKAVAIIGTREPTAHGKEIAKRITRFFTEQQWSIISGLAIGCDAIAHQEAIDEHGHTVAVLAHGLHTIAPSRHRKLADSILERGGALVSEYMIGEGAKPQHFVKRDRTQAGFAQGVVMVQSDLKGGSLHASRAAIEYGRWLAVPYPTPVDRANAEPKIQANLAISEGSSAVRNELLKLRDPHSARLITLRSKDDYPLMIKTSGNEDRTDCVGQDRLI